MAYIIAAEHERYHRMPGRLAERTGQEFFLISQRADLSYDRLKELRPRYVFFPHWSHLIPPGIFHSFECVIFHMTDLPFGRGGSPLQNLIARGIYETMIAAFRCGEELDAGPIYMKRPFSLQGSAEEIYLRAADVVEEMIAEIIRTQPTPTEQEGEAVVFTRRKREDGSLEKLADLNRVFDFIRMLDAEGYPKAYLESEHLRFEFARAALQQDSVIADVRITRKTR